MFRLIYILPELNYELLNVEYHLSSERIIHSNELHRNFAFKISSLIYLLNARKIKQKQQLFYLFSLDFEFVEIIILYLLSLVMTPVVII